MLLPEVEIGKVHFNIGLCCGSQVKAIAGNAGSDWCEEFVRR